MTKQIVSTRRKHSIDILCIDTEECYAEISLFGGQLISFVSKADQRERIWMSEQAFWDKSRALRGGVPICWPWFANNYPSKLSHQQAAHGVLRTCDWQLQEWQHTTQGLQVILRPIQANIPSACHGLEITASFLFHHSCSISLSTTNHANVELSFGAALHSYFKVPNVQQLSVEGLANSFFDKVDGQFKQGERTLHIDAETDRVYKCNESSSFVELIDTQGTNYKQSISCLGAPDLVVWNPWQAKSKTRIDRPNEAHLDMLCVEAAIAEPISLPAGQSHTLSQTFD